MRLRRLLGVYLVLLLASHAQRAWHPFEPELRPGDRSLELRAVDGEAQLATPARVAFRDLPARKGEPAPAVLLLHGSPGSLQDFRRIAHGLSGKMRVIAPDLPGFGASSRRVPDYSMRAHAHYALQLLDALGLGRVHVVAFSMGGGVALELAQLAPKRVASLSLVSALGVQELELLGDYQLNHLIHAFQLAAIWTLEQALPHFGLLDRSPLGTPYARNFFDSDQRRLRAELERFEAPMLILHGEHDSLVPLAAAREHARLVPQARLRILDGGHMLIWSRPELVLAELHGFLASVERGTEPRRSAATPERVEAAARAFDPDQAGPRSGFGYLVFALLVLLATLVSEDLTCIGIGLLVGSGQLGFGTGVAACVFGLVVGDLLLYLAGRLLGRAILLRTPLRRLVASGQLELGSQRLQRSGAAVILLSRFLPGARLPTYVAAGAIRFPIGAFTLWLCLAALLWTPLIVGLSAALGSLVLDRIGLLRGYTLAALLGIATLVLVITRLLVPLASFRGRRLLLGRWRRLRHFEFWPTYLFYAPVIAWVLCLALRYRSLALLSVANPGIVGSGLSGEPKHEILAGLSGTPEFLPATHLLRAGAPLAQRLAAARGFMRDAGLGFPVVLKPDVGERGKDVEIVRDDAGLEAYLAAHPADSLLQEYAPGQEFGVLYVRHPDHETGRVFSWGEKRMISVLGDGESTLEQLILSDERAVCMAPRHLARHAGRLAELIAAGERFALVEIGTHSRGSLFLDGSWVRTSELEASFDRISRGFAGFCMGRYDVRTEDLDEFRAGRGFKIVELNGITGEPAHIYDPKTSLLEAYRVLFRQWSLVFEFAAANRANGARPLRLRELWRLVRG